MLSEKQIITDNWKQGEKFCLLNSIMQIYAF